MRAMLKEALRLGGPKAVRWPRGGVEPAPDQPVEEWPSIEWGSWEVVKEPRQREGAVWILGLGPTLGYALQAAADHDMVGVISARFVKPLDRKLLASVAKNATALITAEDHTVVGGLGSAVLEALAEDSVSVPVRRRGIQDTAVPHGDPKKQHEEFGYGPNAMRAVLQELGVLEGVNA